MLFDAPLEIVECDDPRQVPEAFARLDAARAQGRSVAGYVAYEATSPFGTTSSFGTTNTFDAACAPAGLPLIYMLVCARPRPVRMSEFLEAHARRNAGQGYSLVPRGEQDADPSGRDSFFAAIARIKAHLLAGRCYQVNYTRRSRFAFQGDPLALYRLLRRLQPTRYAAFVGLQGGGAVLSLSPELFFELRPAQANGATDPVTAADWLIETRPMKGTSPRYQDPELDRQSRDWLARDPKSLAEHRMIVDLLRNDLGVHARLGSVTVLEALALESHDTVHQMTSLVRARLAPAYGRELFQQVFPALFPGGSITGAPKHAVRQMIRELETEPRGVYTGAVGFATPDRARFNVAIRTLEIERPPRDAADGEGAPRAAWTPARYGSGCGIVWDSDSAAEWEEYRLKQAFLRAAEDDFRLIETLLFDGEDFVLWPEHRERLSQSARFFSFPLKFAALETRVRTFARSNRQRRLRVRLTCDREGGLEMQAQQWQGRYGALDLAAPPPWPAHDPPAGVELSGPRVETVRVRLSEHRIWSGDPFRRHKTTQRALYDQELQQARSLGFDDSLFLNERGEVVESAIASLLIHTPDDRWLSPAVDCGALPGVFLAGLKRRFPGRIEAVRLSLEAARAAGQWYLVNSVRGARQVIAGVDWQAGTANPRRV